MKFYYWLVMSALLSVSFCKSGGKEDSKVCTVNEKVRQRLELADSIVSSLSGEEDRYFCKKNSSHEKNQATVTAAMLCKKEEKKLIPAGDTSSPRHASYDKCVLR